MKVVGITGPSGSGKTYISNLLKSHGAYLIDADKISRKVSLKGHSAYKKIVNLFDNKILLPDGEINRKALAMLVFNNKVKLEKLEEIIHFYVKKEIYEQIKQINKNDFNFVLIDAPLLIEANFELDYVIVVLADEDIRYNRIKQRDNIEDKEIKDRFKNQLSDNEFIEHADYVIYNNKELDENINLDNLMHEIKMIGEFNEIKEK